MLKALARVAGFAVTLAALLYVGWTLYRSGVFEADVWTQPSLWLAVGAASLVYGAALAPVALAWIGLVESASAALTRLSGGVWMYALSQLYKYLPTNLFHYVGRHLMLRKQGVEHSAAVWGVVAEAVLIIGASVSVAAVFGYAALTEMLSDQARARLALLAAGLAAVALAGAVAAWRFRERLPAAALRFLAPAVRAASLRALALYWGFFLLSGLAFWLIGAALPDAPGLGLLIAVGAGSWTLGFLTPGAAAGIGVREAAIIGSLQSAGLDAASASLLAIAYRAATIFGDLVFLAGAYPFRPREAGAAPPAEE